MDRSSADAFVYAKASGSLAKSFVGERANKLFAVTSLQELWSLVFKTEIPAVPEIMLAKKIEQEAEKRFLSGYISLLRNYSHPEPVLVEILHFYDYDNLKDITASLSIAYSLDKSPQIMEYSDIAEYSMLNYDKWPDVEALTADSPLSWCKSVPSPNEQQALDYKLDIQYIRSLWNSLQHLPSSCRSVVTLRLRVYYGFSKEQVLSQLPTVCDYKFLREVKADPIAKAAVETLNWDLDSYNDWAKWKYANLLNPHEEGEVWQVDPRWIQQAAKVMYNKKALQCFHRNPFSAAVLVSWFKIKQYELDCIRMVAEGLRLNVAQEQIVEFGGLKAN